MPIFECVNCKTKIEYQKGDVGCVCENCGTRYMLSYGAGNPSTQGASYDINEVLKNTYMPEDGDNVLPAKPHSDDTLDTTYIEDAVGGGQTDFESALKDTFILDDTGLGESGKSVHDISLGVSASDMPKGDFEDYTRYEPFLGDTPHTDINQALNDTFIDEESAYSAAKQKAWETKETNPKESAPVSEQYNYAKKIMKGANTPTAFQKAAAIFHDLNGYEDAQELERQCLQKAEESKKDAIYYTAVSRMGVESVSLYEQAIEGFRKIPGWRDADALCAECESKRNTLREERARQKKDLAAHQKKRKLMFGIGIPAVLLLVVFIITMIQVIVPRSRYTNALADAANGDVVSAYETLVDLNYKDSSKQAQKLYPAYKAAKIKVAAVGDVVYFGAFEQDANTKNGKEDLAWQVLDKKGNRLFLITRDAPVCKPFQNDNKTVDWEHSDIRKWLNKEFIETAFNEQEQKKILTTALQPDTNPDYPIAIANETKDKVFLLSIKEAKTYFADDEARMCVPTPYTKTQGVYISDKKYTQGYTCCWNLRTAGYDTSFIAFVYFDGSFRNYGGGVNTYTVAMRPAMWIEVA